MSVGGFEKFDDAPTERDTTSPSNQPKADNTFQSRRSLVRHGVKLAFVAPIISTFFARDVYAANYSCYATGHACDGVRQEDCCSASCNVVTDLCD